MKLTAAFFKGKFKEKTRNNNGKEGIRQKRYFPGNLPHPAMISMENHDLPPTGGQNSRKTGVSLTQEL
jgi:hypothetical protein